MPRTARYDNWNPIVDIDSGDIINCKVSTVRNVERGLLLLPGLSFDISLKTMKRNALVMEGEKPVAMAYDPQSAIVTELLAAAALILFPAAAKTFDTSI